jgi:hypothetical protein
LGQKRKVIDFSQVFGNSKCKVFDFKRVFLVKILLILKNVMKKRRTIGNAYRKSYEILDILTPKRKVLDFIGFFRMVKRKVIDFIEEII